MRNFFFWLSFLRHLPSHTKKKRKNKKSHKLYSGYTKPSNCIFDFWQTRFNVCECEGTLADYLKSKNNEWNPSKYKNMPAPNLKFCDKCGNVSKQLINHVSKELYQRMKTDCGIPYEEYEIVEIEKEIEIDEEQGIYLYLFFYFCFY